MKAKGLGVLSAVTASVCCLGPLLLITLGLGSLGVGAVLGKYHWYLILSATFLLALAWHSYLKEKRSCESARCKMEGKKITRNVLVVASAVVLIFTGLNLYTHAKGISEDTPGQAGTRIAVPVEGMSCFTCEIAVQSAVKKLPGIQEVKASAREGKAVVVYDPVKASLDDIIETINQTGYRAKKPVL